MNKHKLGITVTFRYHSFTIETEADSFDECRREILDYLHEIEFSPMSKAIQILNGQLEDAS